MAFSAEPARRKPLRSEPHRPTNAGAYANQMSGARASRPLGNLISPTTWLSGMESQPYRTRISPARLTRSAPTRGRISTVARVHLRA